jgi:hypothetical protein
MTILRKWNGSMDNTVEYGKQCFPQIDQLCGLKTYKVYYAEFEGYSIAKYSEFTLWNVDWGSVVAVGAKKELDLLWNWQLEHRRYETKKNEAVFELHYLGDDLILGMQFGYDGTKVLYLSSVELNGHIGFYGPVGALLETGLELTPELLDD